MTERTRTVEERLELLEKAVETIALWLAQTPGVWGEQDYRGIQKILKGEK